jgi:hypothetical protein
MRFPMGHANIRWPPRGLTRPLVLSVQVTNNNRGHQQFIVQQFCGSGSGIRPFFDPKDQRSGIIFSGSRILLHKVKIR